MSNKAIRPELREGVLDFSEAISWLEQKYCFSHRDYAKSHGHFDLWCDQKGYGQIDPAGQHRGGSQIWFAEYKQDAEGDCKRPRYQDFWHWLIDYAFAPIKKGKTYPLDLDFWLGEFAENLAPELQALSDKAFAEAMSKVRRMASPEFFAEYSRSNKAPEVFPEFVKTILGYFKAEWGSKLKVCVGTW